jgi:hypothetical protein
VTTVVTPIGFEELWADPEVVAATCPEFTFHEITTWNGVTSYETDDLVYAADGFVYRATQDVPLGLNPAISTTALNVLFDEPFDGDAGTALTTLGYDPIPPELMPILDGQGNAVGLPDGAGKWTGAAARSGILSGDHWIEWTLSAKDISTPVQALLLDGVDEGGGVDSGYAVYLDADVIGLLRLGVNVTPTIPLDWTEDMVVRYELQSGLIRVLVNGTLAVQYTIVAPLPGVAGRTGFRIESRFPDGMFMQRHVAGDFTEVVYWERDDQAAAEQKILEDAIAQASWVLWSLTNGAFHGEQCWAEDYKLTGCKIRLRRGPVEFIKSVERVHHCGTDADPWNDWCLEAVNVVSFCCAPGTGSVGQFYPRTFMCGCDGNVFRITYAIDNNLPPGTSAIVGWLACEYAKAAANKACSLPERVQSITRQGVSWTVLDPQDFLTKGYTGMGRLDHWLAIARRNISGQFIDPMAGIRTFSRQGDCGGQFGDQDVTDPVPDPFDLAFRTQS